VLNLGGFGASGPCGCCGGGGASCGYSCSVCGGIYLNYAAASITDANGTATFPLYWGGVSTVLTSATALPWSTDTGGGICATSTVSGFQYRYRISCSGSDVLIEIIPNTGFAVAYSCSTPSICVSGGAAGYYYTGAVYYGSYLNTVPAIFSDSVTPTCSGGNMTATAAFSTGCSVPVIVASASLSVPYAASASGWCCQSINVTGCNGLPLSGALVEVYDTMGGTLLDSATTGDDGVVGVQWSGSCSVYVVVSKCLFDDNAGSYTFVPQGSTTIPLTATTPSDCEPGHADPKASVLFTVYDCDNVTPCVGALVVISSGDSGVTDGSGEVTLQGWPGDTIAVTGCDYTGVGTFPECGTATDLFLDCPLCDITGTVTACGGLPVWGATINLDGVYATTTASDGTYTITGVSAGSVTVQAVCSPRLNSSSSTVTISCPGTTTVNFSLTAASGYHCTTCFPIPLKDTIYLTDSVLSGGTPTLIYTAGVWTQEIVMDFPGGGSCGASSVTMNYTLNADCTTTITWNRQFGCPAIGGSQQPQTTVMGTNYGPTDCAISTAFQFNGTMSVNSPIYPGGATYTITE